MDTVALFRSPAFNTTEPKEHFVNPSCYGDDLARWLMVELRGAGLRVDDEPGAEDFGWYFEYEVEGQKYCAVIGGDGEGEWYVVVERACGFFASLLGGRHRGVEPAVVSAIEAVLSNAEPIEGLRWGTWKRFRSGELQAA